MTRPAADPARSWELTLALRLFGRSASFSGSWARAASKPCHGSLPSASQPRRHALQREAFGTQRRGQLLPGERCGHRSTGARSRGERRDRGRPSRRCAGHRETPCPRAAAWRMSRDICLGSARTSVSTTDLVKRLASSHGVTGRIGTTTCRPLPPVVLTKPVKPSTPSPT